MKKIFFIFFLLSLFNLGLVFSYVPVEPLFEQAHVFGFSKGISEKISQVEGIADFSEKVLSDEKPVVVNVFAGARNRVSRSIYRDVAQTFGDRVKFVYMDITKPENFTLVKGIMVPLGIGVIKVPFLLFFKKSTLVLPPKFLPPVMGLMTPETVIRIKKSFFDFIQKEFLSKNTNFKNKKKFFVSKKTKLEKFSEKMNKLITRLQRLPRKEVKAYNQIAERSGNRKSF